MVIIMYWSSVSARAFICHCLAPMLIAISAVSLAASGKEDSVVQWTVEQQTIEAAPGATIQLKVKCEIAKGWHIYSAKKYADVEAPFPTSFRVESGPAKLDGEISATNVKIVNSVYPMPIETLEGSSTFTIPLTVSADAKTGDHAVKMIVKYLPADDVKCHFPDKVPLSITVKVVEAASGRR